VSLLDELIERYDKGAVVTVSPYMPDSSGEILRWVVQIDGEEPPDMDVRIDKGDPWVVMSLVRGDEELEVGRWSSKNHPEGALVSWTLGGLRRSDRFGGPAAGERS
jgi:hypothetical protein